MLGTYHPSVQARFVCNPTIVDEALTSRIRRYFPREKRGTDHRPALRRRGRVFEPPAADAPAPAPASAPAPALGMSTARSVRARRRARCTPPRRRCPARAGAAPPACDKSLSIFTLGLGATRHDFSSTIFLNLFIFHLPLPVSGRGKAIRVERAVQEAHPGSRDQMCMRIAATSDDARRVVWLSQGRKRAFPQRDRRPGHRSPRPHRLRFRNRRAAQTQSPRASSWRYTWRISSLSEVIPSIRTNCAKSRTGYR